MRARKFRSGTAGLFATLERHPAGKRENGMTFTCLAVQYNASFFSFFFWSPVFIQNENIRQPQAQPNSGGIWG
jgi:hypothetical protein